MYIPTIYIGVFIGAVATLAIEFTAVAIINHKNKKRKMKAR